MGADEFLPDAARLGVESSPALSAVPPDRVRQAYDRLGVNSGYLSSDAAAWFRVGRALPMNFTEVTGEPVIKRLVTGGLSVAVIHFPPLPIGSPPSLLAERIRRVTEAARSVADAQLIVGVSPWGLPAEEEALPLLQGSLHVLVGGGPGPSFSAAPPPTAPELLWVRPGTQGKHVSLIDILSLPAPGSAWTPGIHVEAREAALSPEIADDPEIAALLR